MSLDTLDDVDSLTDILKMLAEERTNYTEVLAFQFHKTFSMHEPTFTLTIHDNGTNEEFTILCNESGCKQYTLEDTMENLENVETKNLEHNSTVNIIINESPKRLRNHELESLGKEIATFIEFVFLRYPLAYVLNLSYLGSGQSSSLPLFILYRVKCQKIKIFSGITIENIMAFSLLKSLALTNIVEGLTKLNEYILEIPPISPENLENVQKKLNTLFRWLPHKTGCSLTINTNLNFPNDQFFNDLILDVERIGLQANIRTNTSINQNFFTSLMEIKANHKPNYVYHISEVEMSFNKIQDTKHFEKLLSICCNMEKITLTVTEEFIDNLLTEGKSRDGARTIIKDSFSYCSTLKNLRSFFIEFQVSIKKNDVSKKSFVSFLFNAIFSVLPDNIENFSFEKITFLNEDNTKMLNTKAGSIRSVSFAGCQNVPQDLIFKFPNLLQVCMVGEMKLFIPLSVYMLIIKYPSGNSCGVDMNDLVPDGSITPGYKENNYYFNLFSRFFNNSIRNNSIREPWFIVFLENIFEYPNYVEIMDMFPLSKY
uniref:HECT domain-containing protein n=1 Tax=Strongyloides venezuelensis TaxID=75913 RepID=A0A0K0F3I1_STRVS